MNMSETQQQSRVKHLQCYNVSEMLYMNMQIKSAHFFGFVVILELTVFLEGILNFSFYHKSENTVNRQKINTFSPFFYKSNFV